MPKRKKGSPKRPKKAFQMGSPRPAMNRSMSTDSKSSGDSGGPGPAHAASRKASICREIIAREKYTRRRLMERFKNTKLEVIMEYDNPIMLWMMSTSDSFKQNFPVFESFGLHLLTKWHDYKQKWRKDVQDEAVSERLRFIMELLKVAGEPLVYNSQKLFWCDVEYDEMTKDLGKFPGNNSKGTHQGLSFMELHFARNLGRSIQLALVQRMHNSVGRDFVKHLLEAALYVIYGDMFNEYVQVKHVGTSKLKAEGFPLAEVEDTSFTADQTTSQPSPATSQERETFRSLQRKRSRSRSRSAETSLSECTFDSSCWRSSSPASSSGSPSRDASPAKSPYIFTDCVAISMVQKEFPRYLFVVEIKSSDVLTAIDVAQLKKAMLGAGIHQNEVIGMLVNQVRAKIYKMNVDTKKKVISFSQVTEVRFAERLADNGKNAFSIEQFHDLFLDVVALMDYSITNILEVKHA